MSDIYYSPRYTSGREKYEYNSDNIGIYDNLQDVINYTLAFLIKKRHIYNQNGEDEDENDPFVPYKNNEDEENNEYDEIDEMSVYEIVIKMKKLGFLESDLVKEDNKFKNQIKSVKNWDDLIEFIENNNDSFYKDGWKVELDKFSFDETNKSFTKI
jgi:hypothetical protein